MELLHEETDEKIIQDNADQHEQEIPEELYASMKYGTGKYNMAHQYETGWKTDEKGNDESSYMRFERYETQVKNFFM
jgi:hypothetical protein